MNEQAMLALAKEFAKNLKIEADLNDFSRALKKLTVEAALWQFELYPSVH
jgi:putative transposase